MTEPQRIFLTGATGFLGAFVLDELLRTSKADVYCLVREDENARAAERLRAHLDRLGLAASCESRIVPVAGDLTLPLLGLPRPRFDALAEELDVIYHVGGQVNFFLPYAALRAANVQGTQEILRLAGSGRTKPVHYTSSMAVFFGRAHLEAGRVSELDTPVLDPGVKSGYTRSKWIAEQLVAAARERGLPAAIYRTTRITGHSRTGVTSNWSDLLNRLLKGCILLGSAPSLTIDVSMVPVDYVSRAMVCLSRQPRSLGRAFHLFHPRPIPWRALVQMVRASGYPLAEIEHDEWLLRLKRAAATGHPERESLAQLWMLLSSPNSLLVKKPQYDAPHSREGLEGTDIVCPRIDEPLVGAYVSFFQRSGYIPLPGT
ncbi:thioester reductase domain-containing protein [Sorangium sp. So ce1151]|uniref:thioester reductase domain-containing protein n=1 Tax=Sorangium sp. So ce1151 TaxID=3133332 RepID=UPI003F5EA777